jgi:hypothetical protein
MIDYLNPHEKTCFSIFSLRRDRFSPGATVMIVSMRLSVRLEVHLEMLWAP